MKFAELVDVDLEYASALAVHLPGESSTIRAVNGGWTVEEHLSALQVDHLAILAWQKTKDGRKGRNRPKPIPRPGDKPPVEAGRFGKAVLMTPAEAKAWARSRIATN